MGEIVGDFLLSGGQTVVFAGDSITDCGRREAQAPYGGGYVRQCVDLITARYPERLFNYINAGISGNTVQDLQGRWQDDVLRHEPNWISIKIGINDLHRNLAQTPNAVPPQLYEACYRDILTRSRDAGARLVLLDPFYISTDAASPSPRATVLALLPQYIEIVHRLVKEFATLHVRTHDLYQEQLKYRSADTFCPEPVHPNTSGHLIIAHGLLQAWGW